MTSGGARVRSGPSPDPHSRTSLRKDLKTMRLPRHGYDGPIPKFPLATWQVMIADSDGQPIEDKQCTKLWAKREKTMWETLWRLPQGAAWSMPEYSYMILDIALYCRQIILCEQSSATAADRGLLPRYADRIGLSEAAMATLGWAVQHDEIADKRAEHANFQPTEQANYPRRMRAVQ